MMYVYVVKQIRKARFVVADYPFQLPRCWHADSLPLSMRMLSVYMLSI